MKQFYKIIGANGQTDPNFKFEIGHMDLRNIPNVDGTYVTDIKHIFAYINYGPFLCYIQADENNIVYDSVSAGLSQEIPGWKIYEFEVGMIKEWRNISVIMELIEAGADPTIENFVLLRNLYANDPTTLNFIKSSWERILSLDYNRRYHILIRYLL